jgi:hypothetical protein
MKYRVGKSSTIPRPNETSVRVDRSSPLGNPFRMRHESERVEVCAQYEKWFYEELRGNKNFSVELSKLKNLEGGVLLQCWCSPRQCHADTIAKYLNKATEYRVAIVGGRDFNDFDRLCKELDHLLNKRVKSHNVVIVCGEAAGADQLGRRYAERRGFQIDSHPALWDKHGKSAGFKRNAEMARVSDAVVAYWDGSSRGTEHMIQQSRRLNCIVRVRKY